MKSCFEIILAQFDPTFGFWALFALSPPNLTILSSHFNRLSLTYECLMPWKRFLLQPTQNRYGQEAGCETASERRAKGLNAFFPL